MYVIGGYVCNNVCNIFVRSYCSLSYGFSKTRAT